MASKRLHALYVDLTKVAGEVDEADARALLAELGTPGVSGAAKGRPIALALVGGGLISAEALYFEVGQAPATRDLVPAPRWLVAQVGIPPPEARRCDGRRQDRTVRGRPRARRRRT